MVCTLRSVSLAACSRSVRSVPDVHTRRKHASSCIVAASSGNLGQLQVLAEPETAASSPALQLVEQPAVPGGDVIHVDGGAIALNLIVLILLLALSFKRILGLERLLGRWLSRLAEQWEYERRNEVLAARQALEQQFGTEDDEGEEGKGKS